MTANRKLNSGATRYRVVISIFVYGAKGKVVLINSSSVKMKRIGQRYKTVTCKQCSVKADRGH
jgi:ribose 1,5-bisphosphokinase PhnN